MLLILLSLMMGAIRYSETSVLTRPTRHHIQEDGILHIHRQENLESSLQPMEYIRSGCDCLAASIDNGNGIETMNNELDRILKEAILP
jgi:hypothetical protein